MASTSSVSSPAATRIPPDFIGSGARAAAALGLPGVWCAQDRHAATGPAVAFSTGHPALDAVLPGRGWPTGLTELLSAQPGLGEAGLLAPALGSTLTPTPAPTPAPTQTGASRSPIRQVPPQRSPRPWLAWVVPERWSWLPYAPGWQHLGLDLSRLLWVRPATVADAAWSIEQMLREGAVGSVIWIAAQATPLQLRRVHWAARSAGLPVFAARPLAQAQDPSPAPLRLVLRPQMPQALAVEVLKCPGPRPPAALTLMHPAPLHLPSSAAAAAPVPVPMPAPSPSALNLRHVVDRPASAEAAA